MTETDDPKVKEWLKGKLEQRMKRLSEIETNEKDINNFFESREIKPIIDLGYYNPNTDKYVLGDWRRTMTPNSSWTTTSAAALTLTCPAGHRYRVYYAGARNASAASIVTLSGTIGGNAVTNFHAPHGAITTGTHAVIGGTGGPYYDGVGVAGDEHIREVWLNATDALVMTLSVYNAGNDTEHLFLFEDYLV